MPDLTTKLARYVPRDERERALAGLVLEALPWLSKQTAKGRFHLRNGRDTVSARIVAHFDALDAALTEKE